MALVREMRPADFVVICFHHSVFGRGEHRCHFRLHGELEQVVVVPRVRPNGSSVALQQLHLAVDGEELLDESASKVKQAQ